MAQFKVIGNIQESSKETEVDWKITGIFPVAESETIVYQSPFFSFADVSWSFHFTPRVVYSPKFAAFVLWRRIFSKYSVKYYYGFKKLDGSVKQLHKGILKEGDLHSPVFYFKLSEIQEGNGEMSSSDVFCITCTLMLESSQSDQPSVFKGQNHKKLISK